MLRQFIPNISHILRALRYPNYRLFFTGQLVSLTGTWMQHLAVGWLVYRLTNSAFALGLIGFTSQISTFFISPFAGVWADHWNRRRIVLVTQSLAMLQALVLAILTLWGNIQIWQIVFLSLLLGVISAFDMPVRQSFTVDLIGNKDDLGNAIALNSLEFNLARFMGPPLAGMVVSWSNEGICFLINALSYLAVVLALIIIRTNQPIIFNKKNNIFGSMREGFQYTFRTPTMRFILILMGIVSFVVMPYAVLLPVFARDVLRGDVQTLGYLMGAAGLGALTGAIFLANKRTIRGMGKIIVLADILLACGLIMLSLSRTFLISIGLMLLIGFGIMIHMAASNTVLQTLVDDDKRGRVMSFYIMAFIGVTPIGNLLAGVIAQRFGAPFTIFCAGFICLSGAVYFGSKLRSLSLVIDAQAKE
ncbi:MAG: MFS transporter [Candidatus Omnitrophica bacterium]|nr:MFS transporter [Candidatus Omnitrophota bacterium]